MKKPKNNLIIFIIIIVIIIVIIFLFIKLRSNDNLSDSEIRKLKLCSSVLLPNVTFPPTGKLKAISDPKLVWDYDDPAPLRIKFLNIPNDPTDPKSFISRTYYEKIRNNEINKDSKGNFIKKDDNGNLVKFDPLEVQFATKINLDLREAIMIIVKKRYQPILPFKLLFVNKDMDAEIRIQFNNTKGCNSYVGKDNLKIPKHLPTMNFEWFDVATVLHEFGHVLGLRHEHKSPFGKTIQWDYSVIYEYFKKTENWDEDEVNFQIIDQIDKDSINGTEFDPKSIMLYFYPAELTKNKEGTSENQRLSSKDVYYIASLYTPNRDEYGNGIVDQYLLDQLNDYYISIYNEKLNL